MISLTQTQQGIYFECVRHQGEAVYNNAYLFRFTERVDMEKLARAIEQVVVLRPVLFTHIVEAEDGTPCMNGPEECNYTQMVERMTDAEFESIRESLKQPFDIHQDRLFRFRLIETETTQYIFVDIHHIISDGLSMRALVSDFDSAYSGHAVREEAVSAFDIAIAEQAARAGEAYSAAKAWAENAYAGSEGTIVPDGDILGEQEERHGVYQHLLSTGYADFSRFCEAEGVSQAALAYGVFGRLLGVLTDKKDVAFASIWHGRHDRNQLRTIQMMVKTFAVRCLYNEPLSVRDFLHAIHTQTKEAMANDVYSFAEVAAATGINSHVLFAYQGTMHRAVSLAGVPMDQVSGEDNATNEPLSLQLMVQDDKLLLEVQYFSNLYSEAYIRRMVECYDALLQHMMEAPEAMVHQTSIMSDRQRTEVATMHQTTMADAPTTTFHDGVLRWAKETPDTVALIATDCTMTYAELNTAVEQLAAELQSRGLTKGDRVVLLLPRRSSFIVSMLAVMRCGAAYIPMDPEYPADRIAYILDDSEGRFVITTADKMTDYEERALDIEELTKVSKVSEVSKVQEVQVDKDDLAYLIYTSGSTGKPKGVMIRHEGATHFLMAHEDNPVTYTMGHESRVVIGLATVSFDMSIMEYGSTLYNGRTFVFADEEQVLNPLLLADLCRRTGVETMSSTPSRLALNMGIEEFRSLMGTHIRTVMVGGEKLPAALMDDLRRLGVQLINAYGPTEITISSSSARMNDASEVHVGRPHTNYTYRVMDRDLNELPVGITGELVIGGRCLARGYNNLPEKTAEVFVTVDGERMYRSGDYARWTEEGNVVILGRTDNQIKLNGLRIELGEIETVLGKQDNIHQGVVMVRKVAGNDKLVAYYVPETPAASEEATHAFECALAAKMGESLTYYMVPTVFVAMPSFPITPAGKIDMRALPEPTLVAEEIVAPETEREEQLLAIAKEVLQQEDFGVTTNLLTIGMTSLLAIRVAVMAKKQHGLDIHVGEMLKSPTVRAIAAAATNTKDEVAVAPHQAGESFPMTFAQQGVYMECLRNPEATFYNIPMLIRMPVGTDAEALRSQVARLISLHPAYFTHFAPEGDEVKMFYPETTEANVELLSLTEDEYEQFKQTCVRPFDLSNGPLYRSAVLTVADRVYLFLDSHHLISDGGSTNVIFEQLNALMAGADVEAEHYTYFDFANDQRRFAQSEAFEEHRQFFAKQLSDYEEVTEVQQNLHEGGTPEQHEAYTFIRNIGRGELPEEATEAHFWLAATTYALGRFVGAKDIYISTVSGGRQNLNIAETVGMFVNTLPFHAHIRDQRVCEYIKETADTFRDTMSHENYPFARIAADYGYTAATTYAFQLGIVDSYMTDDAAMHAEVLGMESPKFKIGVMIDVREGKPAVVCQYDSTLYTPRLMQALADSIEATAMHMLADLDAPIASVSIVPDGGLERVAEMGCCPKLDYPMDDTIVRIFRRSAAAHPDKTAVVFRDKRLTYSELDALTDRLAAHLVSLGVTNSSIVGVMIERSELMAVYPMAIMKTGAAYMPLDPEFPEDRLTFMIEDAGVALILSDDGLVRRVLPGYTGGIFERSAIDSLPASADGLPAVDSCVPDGLMVVLYTSGSTGKPKGVLLEQHNIVNFCYWYVSAFAVTERDRTAAFANFGFDAHMIDLYPTFLAGAEVHILDADIRHDLQGMANYFNDNQLTIAFMTTQIGCQMVTLFDLPSMRVLSTGGEKMPPLTPPPFDFYNVYGPTECSLFSSYYKVEGPFDGRLIGRPLAGYRLYVVDQDKNILPVGAAGELLIMGHGVARGYLNRPDVNSEKFIEYQGERAYRSGDRVRWTEDGDIEYMGRMDGQVKLRGLRIELGEVDSVMSRHPAIKVATAAVKEVSGTQHLCGYYMLKDGATLDEQELRYFMRQSLTEFMIPDFLLCMESMPLTPNGKVDKRALPLPKVTATGEYVEPRNDTERFFCDTIAQVLGVERVGAEDNFFEIGGTSLIAMRLSVAVGNAGYQMAYKDFFDNPTPAKMAAFVSGGAVAEPEIDHEIADYDYTVVNDLAARSRVETYLADTTLNDLGRVLLLGATGYLGIHVLKQLLDDESVPTIHCMVRGSKSISAESRLRTLLFYYFGETYEAEMGKRLFVIDGDITNADCFETIHDVDTVINCAANVKHFSAGTDIEDINYHGAVNCLNLCLRLGARFIQTSTCSVGGSTLSDTAGLEPHCLRESEFYFGQDLSNKYAHSKFLAERAVLEAIVTRGLRAKIMRLGNLAPRAKDGEFQANFNTNASMRRLKAYTMLGAVAYPMMVEDIEFTPIDEAARAVLLLSRTNDNCNIYHIVNPHHSLFGDVINCLRHTGYAIRATEMPEFTQILMQAMTDPVKADVMQSLVAYSARSDGRYAVGNTYMSLMTAEVLLRLGFCWNPTSWDYVEQFIHAIQGLGFFDE